MTCAIKKGDLFNFFTQKRVSGVIFDKILLFQQHIEVSDELF